MIVFQMIALMCALAFYLLLVGASCHLAFRSPLDPDCRVAGIFLLLILVGTPAALLGFH